MKTRILLIAVLMTALTGVLPVWARAQVDDSRIKAVLITMDSVDEHWLKVKAGAEAKAAELGNINLIYNAPPG
ncbi:MAG: sugar ABC transporter substrate-binding protein, partial [Treponema sp.]|nr:sugar ABC transporter substrate-binding protein [Treponema sp.]